MHLERKVLSCGLANGESRNNFKFGTFIGRFPSDGAANMAVKGLILQVYKITCLTLQELLFCCRSIGYAFMNEIMSEPTDEKRQSPIRSSGSTVQNARGLNRTHTPRCPVGR